MRFCVGNHAAACSAAWICLLIIGCGDRTAGSRQVAPSEVDSADNVLSAGVAALGNDLPASPETSLLAVDAVDQPPSLAVRDAAAATGDSIEAPPGDEEEQALSEALFADDADAGEPAGLPVLPVPAADRLQLRSDLSPQRLVDFLRSVDTEMQNVATGRKQMFDVDEANAEMRRLAKLKLEAAGQLEEKAAADSDQMSLAIRGQLQSLSHLAALGDLPAAKRLEKLAWEHIDSERAAVALDSQMVLVGLAMERLQNGNSSDADEILKLIERIAAAEQTPDVSSLMVMGQARAVLQQYGYDEAAQQVRSVIVELFANHPNPNVGAMAIQLVGSSKFADIDKWLREFERSQNVPVDQWQDAVEKLLSESADMAAVQYLASAALQFEAYGSEELADATFEVLSRSGRFGQREENEIAIAAEARQTRRAVIGQQVPLDLPSVDGRPLSLDSYRGRVVLMPFWAIAFPDSLAVLQTLDQVRQQFGDTVEIVGMNLDVQDAPADEFLVQSPVEFRSFQSVPAASGANPMATRFGVASLPFVVILGPDATVAGINMTGQGISEQVQEILSP